MNFHHGSVAATVPLGSRRCQARRLTRSFRQSPTENRSRHPSQYPWRLSVTARFGSGDCPVRLPALSGRKAHPEVSPKPDREPQSPSEARSVQTRASWSGVVGQSPLISVSQLFMTERGGPAQQGGGRL